MRIGRGQVYAAEVMECIRIQPGYRRTLSFTLFRPIGRLLRFHAQMTVGLLLYYQAKLGTNQLVENTSN